MNNNIVVHENGELEFNGNKYKCAIGYGGFKKNKKEGDGTTPVGCFRIREVFYRKDKLGELTFPFKTSVINKNDAWCDDVRDKRYNTHVLLNDGDAVIEKFWRDDDLYDIIVVLGYNDSPVVAGKGSAIFMHIARCGYTETEGCIALSLKDMLNVLNMTTSDTRVCIIEK